MQGIPPPAIHIHCTITRVSGNPSGVPLGKLPSGLSAAQAVASEDASQEERDTFDAWLRSRWERKDALMHQFYVDGDFVKGAFAQSPAAGEYRREKGQEGLEKPKVGGGETKAVPEREEIKYLEIPVGLRSNREIGDVFAWGAAWGVIYGVVRALKWVGGSAR